MGLGQVLAGTIQDEIASSAEKAYPSLPISNTKNLLFMKSEGEVIQFAKQVSAIMRTNSTKEVLTGAYSGVGRSRMAGYSSRQRVSNGRSSRAE
jgi:hypothetical protein